MSSRFEARSVLGVLVLGVVAVGCSAWFAIHWAYPDLDKAAAFGELFGAINALFAGLAFAALAYTLILQQRALNVQRDELETQREDLRAQSEQAARADFESMLVQLLGFHHSIMREVRIRYGAKDLQGSAAFRALADEVNARVKQTADTNPSFPGIVVAQNGYESFHKAYRGVLDHYFRNLYHIVKFIDSSAIADPRRYTSLVRAQLSPAELLLIFYNGLSPHGEKFNPLITKYALLEQLSPDELRLQGHKSLYQFQAYG